MAWTIWEPTSSLLDRSIRLLFEELECVNIILFSYFTQLLFLVCKFLSFGSTSNHLNAIKKKIDKKSSVHNILYDIKSVATTFFLYNYFFLFSFPAIISKLKRLLWLVSMDNFNRYILFIYKAMVYWHQNFQPLLFWFPQQYCL